MLFEIIGLYITGIFVNLVGFVTLWQGPVSHKPNKLESLFIIGSVFSWLVLLLILLIYLIKNKLKRR